MENLLHKTPSTIPHNMSSPIRVAAIGNHTGQVVQGELVHSLANINCEIHQLPTYHYYSLPKYTNSTVNGFPYSPTGSVSIVTTCMALRPEQLKVGIYTKLLQII